MEECKGDLTRILLYVAWSNELKETATLVLWVVDIVIIRQEWVHVKEMLTGAIVTEKMKIVIPTRVKL